MNIAVEYKKHLLSDGSLINPPWIISGGFFHNINNNTYIGIILSTDSRNYYVPNTLKIMNKSTIQSRNLIMRYPNETPNNDILTDLHNEALDWATEQEIT